MMTFQKHMIDTMKEWQIKIGGFESAIRLYYPKTSLCRYLNLDIDIENDILRSHIEEYFADNMKYLGTVTITAQKDRFCIMVGKEGCDYVEKNIPKPDFLAKFLDVIKCQEMNKIQSFFEEYADQYDTSVCMNKEKNGLETVFYFENEDVEPYVYCIDQNEFGITYHRFTKEDYIEL